MSSPRHAWAVCITATPERRSGLASVLSRLPCGRALPHVRDLAIAKRLRRPRALRSHADHGCQPHDQADRAATSGTDGVFGRGTESSAGTGRGHTRRLSRIFWKLAPKIRRLGNVGVEQLADAASVAHVRPEQQAAGAQVADTALDHATVDDGPARVHVHARRLPEGLNLPFPVAAADLPTDEHGLGVSAGGLAEVLAAGDSRLGGQLRVVSRSRGAGLPSDR
jgi:hypothetical protein